MGKKTYLLLLLIMHELSQRLHDTPFLLADITDPVCLACSHDGVDCVPFDAYAPQVFSLLDANFCECSGVLLDWAARTVMQAVLAVDGGVHDGK